MMPLTKDKQIGIPRIFYCQQILYSYILNSKSMLHKGDQQSAFFAVDG